MYVVSISATHPQNNTDSKWQYTRNDPIEGGNERDRISFDYMHNNTELNKKKNERRKKH